MIIILSLVATSLATLSGIMAVGSGRHWQFTVGDYFRGKRNAILYLWVVLSTIYSLGLAGVIAEYGIDHDWHLRVVRNWKWFALHMLCGTLMTFAHVFVKMTLSKELGPIDKYLWGKHNV